MLSLTGYLVTHKIHDGVKHKVYRACRTRDNCPVVLKVIKSSHPSNERLARFQREYELTHSLADKGVIDALGLEQVGDGLAMVLEDFAGQPLSGFVVKTREDLQVFLSLTTRICQILGRIHHKQVIHGDINPNNILWNRETDDLRIIDFGIARELVLEVHNTDVSHLEGTLAYLAPEQTGRLNRSVSSRSDIYSLGVCFYELLTGELPFTAEDDMGLIYAHIARDARPVHERNPLIPKYLSLLIGRMMAKDPEERYHDGTGVAADLTHCLEAWIGAAAIEPFQLGVREQVDRFRIPEKLYGREREISELASIIEDLPLGPGRVAMVAGESGIGKSILVREVRKMYADQRGFFLNGKFEEMQAEMPYHGFCQALGELARSLLCLGEERLLFWREKLCEALGPNGYLVTTVAPELEAVVGSFEPLEKLGPKEEKDRFFNTFRRFFCTLACQEHPLVLFLDDLQWADPSSLGLIENLIGDVPPYMCLLGTHRTDQANHAPACLETIGNSIFVHRIQLSPLAQSGLENMVADCLGQESEQIRPLSQLIHTHTGGNPLFSRELLHDLHTRGLIVYAREQGHWLCDLAKIEDLKISDNAVGFLIQRLTHLDNETRELLVLAGCIGNRFDLFILAAIADEQPSRVIEILWRAVGLNLVTPIGRAYRLPGFDEQKGGLNASYQFTHDRIQTAAYCLCPQDRRPELHLRIGRLLLTRTSHRERDVDLIELTKHLNLGHELVVDEEERQRLCRLNLDAGKKARASTAYTHAFNLFKLAIELLPEDAWNTHYEICFQVHRHAAEAAFLCGMNEVAETFCGLLRDYGRGNWERARVLRMQLVHYTVLGKTEKAIGAGLQGLELLGLPLPRKPSHLKIAWEMAKTRWAIHDLDVPALANRPTHNDALLTEQLALLLGLAMPSFYLPDKKLWLLVNLTRARLCLAHNNCPEGTTAFATFGIILNGVMGRHADAYAFGKLALTLDKSFAYLPLRPKLFFIYGLFIHPWNHHWKSIDPYLEQAESLGRQVGDLVYANNATVQLAVQNDPSLDLETAQARAERYLNQLLNNNYRFTTTMAQPVQQFRKCLRGLTSDPLCFDDGVFEEEAYLREVEANEDLIGKMTFFLTKVNLAYIFDDFRQARQHLDFIQEHRSAVLGTPQSVDTCFFLFLTTAATYPNQTGRNKRKAWKCLHEELARMSKWARHCPVNFEHRQLLMAAELSALKGGYRKPISLYLRAAKLARENEYLNHRPLILDCTARFFMRLGEQTMARAFLREAEYCYTRWGALARAKDLRLRYAHHFDQIKEWASEGNASPITGGPDNLDLASVMKAAQVISGELALDRLIEKTMCIVVENAGAQRACLILPEEDHLKIEAVADGDVIRRPQIPLRHADGRNMLPASVVTVVHRTGKALVLDQVAEQGAFTGDAYIQARKPRSVLCMPLVKQGKILGVLYLEHLKVAGVFTPERVQVLELLAATMAISIRHARFYAHLEEEVRARTSDLDARNRELETLDDLVRNFTSENEPERFYDTLLNQCILLFDGVRYGALFLLRQGCYRPVSCAGFAPQKLADFSFSPLEVERDYLPLTERWSPEILIIRDVSLLPGPIFSEDQTPVACRLIMTLMVSDRTEGYLILDGEKVSYFQRANLDQLSRFANHAAIAVAKARLWLELEGKNAEVLAKNQAIVETQNKLVMSEKMASLGTLTAGVAHEINNPNNFIAAGTQVLGNTCTQFREFLFNLAGEEASAEVVASLNGWFDRIEKHLSDVSEGSHRIDAIIKDLRLVTRLNEAESKQVDLSESLRAATRLSRPRFPQVSICLELDGRLELFCRPAEISQVFLNLITNGCQAIERRSKADEKAEAELTISCRLVENEAQIQFEDNGCGMSEQVRERIFDAFYTTLPTGQGAGLGLYSAWRIVESHGGRLDVHSVEGEGSVFNMFLPLTVRDN